MMVVTLLTGFFITLISLLVGYSLGKYHEVLPPAAKKQLTSTFQAGVSKRKTEEQQATQVDTGAVTRPTAIENYYRDHPEVYLEHKEIADTFEKLKE